MSKPIPMILLCPLCCARHVDEDEWAEKPHHTHACQDCGFVWRPAVVDTVGVQFLPGFKNDEVKDVEEELEEKKPAEEDQTPPGLKSAETYRDAHEQLTAFIEQVTSMRFVNKDYVAQVLVYIQRRYLKERKGRNIFMRGAHENSKHAPLTGQDGLAVLSEWSAAIMAMESLP